MTLAGHRPGGFHHDAYRMGLPGGPGAFARARRGLQTWQAHLGAGLRVQPRHPPQEGATVVVAIPLGPLTAVAPCRIVGVVDEPHRFGFAYGTLPGHPESGEEAFVVEASEDGVALHILAASHPSGVLARLGAPVGRRIQTATTRRYLEAFHAGPRPRGDPCRRTPSAFGALCQEAWKSSIVAPIWPSISFRSK